MKNAFGPLVVQFFRTFTAEACGPLVLTTRNEAMDSSVYLLQF